MHEHLSSRRLLLCFFCVLCKDAFTVRLCLYIDAFTVDPGFRIDAFESFVRLSLVEHLEGPAHACEVELAVFSGIVRHCSVFRNS